MADDMKARLEAATTLEAEQKARSAKFAAERQKLDLQIAREKARQPESPVEQLKALKDALPAVSPSLPSTLTTISEKTLIAAPYVYASLPGAVEDLVGKIKISQSNLRAKNGTYARLILIDQSISNDVAEYQSILSKAGFLLTSYSKSGDGSGDSNNLASIGLMEVAVVGIALAQKAYEAFKTVTTISPSSVELDPIIFENLVRAKLNHQACAGEAGFGAVQLETINWSLSSESSITSAQTFIEKLIDVSKGYEGDALEALNVEIGLLTKAYMEFGIDKAMKIERLMNLMREDNYFLLYVNILHASAMVVIQDKFLRPQSILKVHPSAVSCFTIMTHTGIVIDSDISVYNPEGIEVNI